MALNRKSPLLGIVYYTKLNYAFMCKRATPFIFVSVYNNRLPIRGHENRKRNIETTRIKKLS